MSDVSTVMTREAVAESGGPGGETGAGETAGDARQFVIFHVKDEMFAVPLAEVKEIIRMPDVVRMLGRQLARRPGKGHVWIKEY